MLPFSHSEKDKVSQGSIPGICINQFDSFSAAVCVCIRVCVIVSQLLCVRAYIVCVCVCVRASNFTSLMLLTLLGFY